MIELKRLKLINWHNFENVTFDCARLTYMIGVNAVGKTTILDAIRYCLTTNRNFNALGNKKSGRTLQGSVHAKQRGENAYRRPGRTVAYIGAEFWDTVKRTNFVIAVRVESEGPMQELHPGDQTWYISEDGITLEKLPFLDPRTGAPSAKEDFKPAVGRLSYTRSPSEARDRICRALGIGRASSPLGKKFNEVFQMGTSMDEIPNFREFLYQYILPQPELDLEALQGDRVELENLHAVLAEAQIKDINGTVLLTPEEIRDALDSGTLDEESIDPTCLTGENGLLQWLWEFFFGKDEEETPQYSGWRTENGKTYYYDQNTHQPVTGIQSIDNKLYYFDASGVQQPATFGIDVSKYQSSIDWDKVKTAGVEFAIIRIGYRGYGSGALVQDPKFEEHFTNARNAGLRVGIYCFSQAVNENEAREEAQACVYVLNGRQLDYPIYFDTEASGAGNGRADGLGVTDRTKCAVAFCEEVKALGYKPGVYASTTWFRKRLDMSQLSNYYIWNAHYNVASSPIACNMWQGTCTARIPGYGGQIDVNISYMG